MLSNLVSRPILANLLMIMFLVGGIFMALNIRKEFLPQQPKRIIEISTQLEGASPREIQNSILLAIEDSINGIQGIKRVDSVATQGIGAVTVTLLNGIDATTTLQEIKSAVDRIQTLPTEAERPQVNLASNQEKVMSLLLFGEQTELTLRRYAEKVQNDLRNLDDITRVEIAIPRPMEVSVEIEENTLNKFDLSVENIAEIIRQNSIELGGGTIRSSSTDIVLKTDERRQWASDFEEIPIITSDNGQRLKLGDIAKLTDGFGPSNVFTWYNSQPAIQLNVFAVNGESPSSVEAAVKSYIETLNFNDAINLIIFENDAEAYRSRVSLLVDNAMIGLVLVLILLALFLEPKLAFWVMMGIPTSLLGGIFLLPLFGATINMISLFAFIITIGIVVDDAIMVAESIFHHRQHGKTKLQASIDGLNEMFIPILLAVGTNILAFLPMFFIPGELGVLFYQIPSVVVAVLIVSLIEALIILAAHLSHEKKTNNKADVWTKLARPQKIVNQGLEKFVSLHFTKWVSKAVHHVGITFAAMTTLLGITIGLVLGGWIPFSFTPIIEADKVTAEAILPFGTPIQKAIEVQHQLVNAAEDISSSNHGIFSIIGVRIDEGEVENDTMSGTNIVSVMVSLPPSVEREIGGVEFGRLWEGKVEKIEGLEALSVSGEIAVTGGEPLQLELSHSQLETAKQAAIFLGNLLLHHEAVNRIDDGVQTGKPELRFKLTSQGHALGMTSESIAAQIRNRFHGAEALRFQRQSNEIKVMVRLEEKERNQLSALENILVRTPSDNLVPLSLVTEITTATAHTQITRSNGRQVYSVVVNANANFSEDIIEDYLNDVALPKTMEEFPGIKIRFGGEADDEGPALAALGMGMLFVIAVIYSLMAITFNSYIQPLILMSVIPFGIIGSILGHVALGSEISIVSFLGIIAMIGVLMNDSLVLMITANRFLIDGMSRREAAIQASCRRLRPVLLTSLTTFVGLAPMLFETSEQAQFLIPMAISICFGLLFATVIVLFLIPALYSLLPMSQLNSDGANHAHSSH
ncbi:efflux RND transporter permease subunit [Hirschia maritima]|uniref:efflux RND transporter permease subunit n=1 Tax=Hirschia maritima TaxID=1121961 RepID=UPI000381BE73|nr:efflux RND transporter permease subunit [Hirschia maritima]